MKVSSVLVLALVLPALSAGCSDDDVEPDAVTAAFTKEQMMDPESCKECHQQHYDEWAGSMHAYASEDPIFLAMNKRGQEETGGDLGKFCVQCHAPMAVALGLTEDGLNLPDLPKYVQGVTCYFCHSAASVDGAHNAQITLADDLVMRGGMKNPKPTPNTAHASTYSALLDRRELASASLCGGCHDIVTPKGVALERTFMEWQASLFAHDDPAEQQTCGDCHMKGRTGTAADFPGVPLRPIVHGHKMVGLDTAITDWPGIEEQKAAIQTELNFALLPQLCVYMHDGEPKVTVLLENLAAGHAWPSGAAQDRRIWVEVVAYDGDGKIIFSTGVVGDDERLIDVDDPTLWRFGDIAYNDAGEVEHRFWEIASVESTLLLPPAASTPLDPDYFDNHLERTWTLPALPDHATMKVHVRAVGRDVIDDLVETGYITESNGETYKSKIPTLTPQFKPPIDWRAEDGVTCFPDI